MFKGASKADSSFWGSILGTAPIFLLCSSDDDDIRTLHCRYLYSRYGYLMMYGRFDYEDWYHDHEGTILHEGKARAKRWCLATPNQEFERRQHARTGSLLQDTIAIIL